LDNLLLDVALCLKQEIEQWLQAERNSHPLNAALDADQDAEQHLSMSEEENSPGKQAAS
jgi:hypothetical protein